MITYDDYVSLYGSDRMPIDDFTRLSLKAIRDLDIRTTGIDGYHKLLDAFPDGMNAKMVKDCACQLCDFYYQISLAERASIASKQADNSGMAVSSRSAGNESISYLSPTETAIDKAAGSTATQQTVINDIIRKGLSGVTDANGVNLLYMGRYPRG